MFSKYKGQHDPVARYVKTAINPRTPPQQLNDAVSYYTIFRQIIRDFCTLTSENLSGMNDTTEQYVL